MTTIRDRYTSGQEQRAEAIKATEQKLPELQRRSDLALLAATNLSQQLERDSAAAELEYFPEKGHTNGEC